MYSFNNNYSIEFVLGCLKNYHVIAERRFYEADEIARDIKLDIDFIISKLNLTEKQEQVLELHFKQGYTQEEIAELWGTSQVNIYYHVKSVRKKIESYLKGCIKKCQITA